MDWASYTLRAEVRSQTGGICERAFEKGPASNGAKLRLAEPHRPAVRGQSTPLIMLPSGEDPIYTRLYRAIREQLLSGNWTPGTKLPSTRLLAQDLGISRGTATIAIEQLIAEGWLTSETRSGVYVARRPPASSQEPRGARFGERERRLSFCDLPMDLFPIGRWRQLHARIWGTANKDDLLLADQPPGEGRLREALARYLLPARGLGVHSDQLVICTSAASAVEIAVRTVVPAGGTVAVENPGDPQLAARLRLGGFKVLPVELDSEGLLVTRLPTDTSISAVVVSPAVHWPTGATLSGKRRDELVRWARSHGAWLIERDCDGHIARERGKPVLPLGCTHGDCGILHVSGLDRAAFPGLNLAFAVFPEALVGAAAQARAAVDRRIPVSDQLVLAEFIETGAMAAWARISAGEIVKRRAAVHDVVASSQDRLFSRTWSAGGLLGLGETGTRTSQLMTLFATWGLPSARLSDFATGPASHGEGLALACAGMPVPQTRNIGHSLEQALHELARSAH